MPGFRGSTEQSDLNLGTRAPRNIGTWRLLTNSGTLRNLGTPHPGTSTVVVALGP